MAWPTIEVGSWQQLSTLAERLVISGPHDVPYVMRGQADSTWELAPSLLRLFPTEVTIEQALSVEKASVGEFRAQAHWT